MWPSYAHHLWARCDHCLAGGLGNFWYLSTLISPLAGKFYLDNAERTEQITVKIVTEDDESSSEVIVQGE
tara:strand:- start:385 stop:594 length:210 start_codon:yes stop_codon:yes gene_type:complete